ncbi:WD domain G-beta repeat [Babesia microti strain RI]|uniref:Probable cytosolic iron-sulfur protein assembly protein CIAO1 homolog n=1 Tax=Babesia microti (strain RI) TaxID=1133968 RepID=A0A1R4AAB4_BABMR|nr:WD domain G-beta repeat [Babesia microti strain RI]SJK85925.1 WD domain G-beta repeat [Babesia microti strain RI]|eukprot:XP_012648102.2 WD domain G-beta repeat [Babesia microti strain RI]
MIEKISSIYTNASNSDIIWTLTWRPNYTQIYYAIKNHIYFFDCDLEGNNDDSKHIRLDNKHKKSIRHISFSKEGNLLLCSSFDSTCTIFQWKNAEWEHVQTLQGHESEVKCISIHNNCKYIATCGRDKAILVYEQSIYDSDVSVMNDMYYCSTILTSHSQDVKCVIWHPKEELLASSSYDNTIKLWGKCEEWHCIQTLSHHKSTVWSLSFDSSGDSLCSASQDQSLNVYGKNTNNSSYELLVSIDNLHEFGIYSVDWHPKLDIIASGGADNKITLITRSSNGLWKTTDKMEYAHNGDVNCVMWKQSDCDRSTANVYFFASSGDDGMINIYKYTHVQ